MARRPRAATPLGLTVTLPGPHRSPLAQCRDDLPGLSRSFWVGVDGMQPGRRRSSGQAVIGAAQLGEPGGWACILDGSGRGDALAGGSAPESATSPPRAVHGASCSRPRPPAGWSPGTRRTATTVVHLLSTLAWLNQNSPPTPSPWLLGPARAAVLLLDTPKAPTWWPSPADHVGRPHRVCARPPLVREPLGEAIRLCDFPDDGGRSW